MLRSAFFCNTSVIFKMPLCEGPLCDIVIKRQGEHTMCLRLKIVVKRGDITICPYKTAHMVYILTVSKHVN